MAAPQRMQNIEKEEGAYWIFMGPNDSYKAAVISHLNNVIREGDVLSRS
jgi:hypothetical protein